MIHKVRELDHKILEMIQVSRTRIYEILIYVTVLNFCWTDNTDLGAFFTLKRIETNGFL